MKKYIVVFKNENGKLVAVSARTGDSTLWVRWFTKSIVNGKDYPRIYAFSTRKSATTYARRTVKRASKLFTYDLNKPLHYEVLPIYD